MSVVRNHHIKKIEDCILQNLHVSHKCYPQSTKPLEMDKHHHCPHHYRIDHKEIILIVVSIIEWTLLDNGIDKQ